MKTRTTKPKPIIAPAPREGGITMLVDDLREGLESVSKNLDELAGRLYPILTPTAPAGTDEPFRLPASESSSVEASLRTVLQDDIRAVRALTERIRDLIERIDL